MAQVRLDMNEEGVAAAHNQRDRGLERREISRGRVPYNPLRLEVRFVMMNSDERFSQSKSQRLAGLETGHESARQAGALCCGNSVDLPGRLSGSMKGRSRYGEKVSEVLPRGEFRNDTAIFGVQLHLRRNDIGQHLAVLNNRHTGLIARGLDGEESHCRSSFLRPLERESR